VGAFESKLGGNTPKYQEFIEYDAEGNPVVLRRSVSETDPGQSDSGAEGSVQEGCQEPEASRWSLGSMRYFCDFKAVATQLRPKEDPS
jgi:hypothetical protein